MNENNNANFTPQAPNFKTLVRMSFQGLTNFPYIEEDFDALTNYGFLSKVVEYLNEVITNNNEQNSLMTGLYNAYVSLQNYVNDYFDNLDVQDEINNKLDDMAQDGSLTNLIKDYVDPIYQAYENTINNRVDGIQLEQSVLSARMDTFTHLTDGSTSGDAELADIRVGYTGITDSSAGDSVRDQVSDVRSIIDNEVIGYSRLKGEFVRGNVNHQGVNDNIQYRIRSKEKLIYPKRIIIPQTVGIYTVNLVTFASEGATTGSNSTAPRGYHDVAPNTYFMVAIRKTDEDTTETADIYAMEKACIYVSDYADNIYELNDKIVQNYANDNKRITSEYYTTEEIDGTLTTGAYITVTTGQPFASVNGQYLEIDSGFNIGDNILVTGYSAADPQYYPCAFFVDSNNVVLKILFGTQADRFKTFRDYETYVPYGTSKIFVNGSIALNTVPKVKKKIYSTNFRNVLYPLNIASSLVREAKKNPFAFSTFDKGYISFVFDDTRSDMDLVASVFAEYGFKLGLATIPANLNETCDGLESSSQGYTVGMTRKAVCDRVVSLGGEILAHNMNVVTVTNQYDFDFMYKYFITTKQDLENNGYNVRGLIRAGGTGAISETPEIEKWLIGNYEYSNQGTAVNYSQDRVNITTNKDSLKSQILSAYNNHTWIKIMGHGISTTTSGNDISLADLREILSYCQTIGITVVTYADMFDNFSSSEFLNSI